MFLLDTDTCSELIRDRRSLGKHLHLLREAEWAISSISSMELRYGMLRLEKNDSRRQYIASFLRDCPVVQFDLHAADRSADVRVSLELSGKSIGFYDPLIAGHALALGAILVTGNVKHFSKVPDLQTVNWLRG